MPRGVRLFSNPAIDATTQVHNPGRMQKECKPGANTEMSITIENACTDGSMLVFKRHVLLWDTGMFSLVDKNSPKTRVRWNFHISPKGKIEKKVLISCQS